MSYAIISTCTGCTACVKICPVNAITGVRKGYHTIDRAICIDCGACGRICPAQAVLDASGELCQTLKRSLWLQPIILADKCISCGICLEVCPTSALDFAALTDHRVRAIAWLKDGRGCIGCSFCAIACPVDAMVMETLKTD